ARDKMKKTKHSKQILENAVKSCILNEGPWSGIKGVFSGIKANYHYNSATDEVKKVADQVGKVIDKGFPRIKKHVDKLKGINSQQAQQAGDKLEDSIGSFQTAVNSAVQSVASEMDLP